MRIDLLPYDPRGAERIAGRARPVAPGRARHRDRRADRGARRGAPRHLRRRHRERRNDEPEEPAKAVGDQGVSDAPFDYVGDSAADIPDSVGVGAGDRGAHACEGSCKRAHRRRGRQVETIGDKGRGLEQPRFARYGLISGPRTSCSSCRCWLRTSTSTWTTVCGCATLLALVAFSLCASAVYVLNDLLDLESDRCHPRKRRRPFASGELPIPFGLALRSRFATRGLGGLASPSSGRPIPDHHLLAIYFALTLSYSLKLKAVVLIDTVVLAGLYTMRVIAGYAATGIVATFWLLAFALFLFFGLAMLEAVLGTHRRAQAQRRRARRAAAIRPTTWTSSESSAR